MISTSSPFSSGWPSGDELPVHLRADAGVADVGMDGIGEIDRRRPARQRDQPALRREAENLVLEELELGVLEEFFRRVAMGDLLDRLPQPGIGAALGRQPVAIVGDAVLVERMRGDAVFGDLVHLARADLQLDALLRADR